MKRRAGDAMLDFGVQVARAIDEEILEVLE